MRGPRVSIHLLLGFRTGAPRGRVEARRAPNRNEKWQDGAHTDGDVVEVPPVASVHSRGASVLSFCCNERCLELRYISGTFVGVDERTENSIPRYVITLVISALVHNSGALDEKFLRIDVNYG